MGLKVVEAGTLTTIIRKRRTTMWPFNPRSGDEGSARRQAGGREPGRNTNRFHHQSKIAVVKTT